MSHPAPTKSNDPWSVLRLMGLAGLTLGAFFVFIYYVSP
jgi:hypothetical protein